MRQAMAEDVAIYDLVSRYCRPSARGSVLQARLVSTVCIGRLMSLELSPDVSIDEHYFQTLLKVKGFEDKVVSCGR